MGTHGYMAPEVLSKGTAYDSSADWFSFGCMLYKLLKGHSPFRQHKTKDKHEIDRMTLTMNVELPDTFSQELRDMLESLLQVEKPFLNSKAYCLQYYVHFIFPLLAKSLLCSVKTKRKQIAYKIEFSKNVEQNSLISLFA